MMGRLFRGGFGFGGEGAGPDLFGAAFVGGDYGEFEGADVDLVVDLGDAAQFVDQEAAHGFEFAFRAGQVEVVQQEFDVEAGVHQDGAVLLGRQAGLRRSYSS